MEPMEKLQFRKGDWLVIGLVIALALAVFLCFLPGNKQPSQKSH